MARTVPLLLAAAIACPVLAACPGEGETSADTAGGQGDLSVTFAGDLPTEDQGPGTGDAANGDGDAADVPESDTGCDCPPKTHCDPSGLCAADVCVKGAATCSDLSTVKLCDEQGASFQEIACPADQVCFGGVCWAQQCEPGELGGCAAGQLLKCNSLGIDWVSFPCPAGEACSDGACRPAAPNVLLLIDTSGSMNWLPDGTDPDDCFGSGCPDWNYPKCDDPSAPQTRLGLVKKALQAVVGSEAAEQLRLGLMRFPQRPIVEDIFIGAECAGGYWNANFSGEVTGDTDEQLLLASPWFDGSLHEIVAEPFGAAAIADLSSLSRWFDAVETTTSAGGACLSVDMCGGGPCVQGSCHVFSNPELRAIGGTPLGKSLFYAGEYLRRYVLVEGKACGTDADCGSPNHTCVQGACHDPVAMCRETIVIAFTDGEETEHVHLTDFFHPRVQAKRMRFGLGCSSDADCTGGAVCNVGVCRPPFGEVDEAQWVCETGELPCSTDEECPDPCTTWATCKGDCLPASVDLTTSGTAGRITDHGGTPVSVRVHLVDASGVVGKNQVIAAYGGGKHFSVDLSDPAELVATVTEILGDAKTGSPCGGP